MNGAPPGGATDSLILIIINKLGAKLLVLESALMCIIPNGITILTFTRSRHEAQTSEADAGQSPPSLSEKRLFHALLLAGRRLHRTELGQNLLPLKARAKPIFLISLILGYIMWV